MYIQGSGSGLVISVLSPKEIRLEKLTWNKKRGQLRPGPSDVNKLNLLETPMGLRRIETADFSGFEKESRGTMRRLVDIER